MNTQHWLLLFLWLLYCLVHSVFASGTVKRYFQKISGSLFKYYRLAYSLLALIMLVLLLWYQFSSQSIFLVTSKFIRYAVSFILLLPGLTIMIICIGKYFYELSGIQVLQKEKPIVPMPLQQRGLNSYNRHPLYSGTILFVWGLFLLFPLLSNLIAAVILTVYVLVGIELEEKKLLVEYGEEYEQYSKRVPKLIPDLKRN